MRKLVKHPSFPYWVLLILANNPLALFSHLYSFSGVFAPHQSLPNIAPPLDIDPINLKIIQHYSNRHCHSQFNLIPVQPHHTHQRLYFIVQCIVSGRLHHLNKQFLISKPQKPQGWTTATSIQSLMMKWDPIGCPNNPPPIWLLGDARRHDCVPTQHIFITIAYLLSFGVINFICFDLDVVSPTNSLPITSNIAHTPHIQPSLWNSPCWCLFNPHYISLHHY